MNRGTVFGGNNGNFRGTGRGLRSKDAIPRINSISVTMPFIWLSALKFRGITDGTQIVAPNDHSVNKTPFTNSGYPIYREKVLGKFSAIEHTSGSILKTAFDTKSGTDYSFLTICKSNVSSTGYNILIGSEGNGGTPGIRWGLAASGGSASSYRLGWADALGNTALGNTNLGTQFKVTLHIKNKLGWIIYENGKAISTVADTSSPTGNYSLIIGGEYLSTQYSFEGFWLDIALWKRVLSKKKFYK
jgi:hypothetical protein